MCGIILAVNYEDKKEDVNEDLMDIYQDQYQRGQEGFGLISINADKTYKVHRATDPIKALYDLYNNQSKTLIFHHRTPTSSSNKIQQTHPIEVDSGSLKHKYLLIHNGTISNHETLKAEHEKLGFTYSTDNEEEHNDSEALAIELARYIEKQTDEMKIWSGAAFIMIQISKKTKKVEKIYFGKIQQWDDLWLAKTRGKIRISSEGEGNKIKEKILYHFTLNGDHKLEKSKLAIIANNTTSNTIGFTNEDTTKVSTDIALKDTTEISTEDAFEDIFTEAIEKIAEKGEEILKELVDEITQEAKDDIDFDIEMETYVEKFRRIITEISNKIIKLRLDEEATNFQYEDNEKETKGKTMSAMEMS